MVAKTRLRRAGLGFVASGLDLFRSFSQSIRMGFLSILLFSLHLQASSLVTETVGQVGDFVTTSREVQISTAIEKVLFPGKGDSAGNAELRVDQPEFRNAVTSVLLEVVVALEAENFSVASVSEKDISEAVIKVDKSLGGKDYWSQLEVSNLELKKLITRKFVAKNFLKFKANSMTAIITDQEAQSYYEKNRLKFGTTSFASFKENIKAFLGQQQLEERLRSWFEVIKRKYKVRNFISG